MSCALTASKLDSWPAAVGNLGSGDPRNTWNGVMRYLKQISKAKNIILRLKVMSIEHELLRFSSETENVGIPDRHLYREV